MTFKIKNFHSNYTRKVRIQINTILLNEYLKFNDIIFNVVLMVIRFIKFLIGYLRSKEPQPGLNHEAYGLLNNFSRFLII